MMRCGLSVLAVLLAGLSSFAQNKSKGPAARPWVEMERGPYLTASIESNVPEHQMTPKGLAVRVRQDPPAYVLFDEDLLRYSTAWVGEVDLRGVVFDGAHVAWPKVKGEEVFGTRNRPGWGKEGSFEDPRTRYPSTAEKPQPEHWRNRAYGPLPHDWGRFKGVYLHGQRVILSYTVGGTPVLDSPGWDEIGGVGFFTRELNIAQSDKDLALAVADHPEGGTATARGANEPIVLPLTAVKDAKGAPTIAVATVGTTEGMRWEIVDGQLRLHVPASATPARIKLLMSQSPDANGTGVREAAGKAEPAADLASMKRGGPARWAERVVTKGELGEGPHAYVVDTLAAPNPNPWKAMTRFGGFDFFKDGKRAAVCTWDGDVWIVEGIDETLEKLTWQRIATGMFQPLGLKILADEKGVEQIYVSCRDQITRLHDLNGDGETDFYEAFNNDHQVTEHFHEFAMDLQADAEGNLYYAKSARHALPPVVPHHGTLIKVSKDGKTSEIVCGGFRAANGVGISPTGELATSDQEGHWTPANRINVLKPGGFYGNMWSFFAKGRKAEQGYEAPLCWIPKDVDRSPAAQLWVTSRKWGPVEGKMLHTSYGTGKLFLVMEQTVESVRQGGIVPIPGVSFGTGVMRGRFHAGDGQLYACGLVGWSSNTPLPTGLYRVRYTGKPLLMPTSMEVTTEGVTLSFPERLDPKVAGDAENYSIEVWQYRWTQNYGSAHYSVENPREKDTDEVEVEAVTVSGDGKTVKLRLAEVRPVMQMKVTMSLKTAEGKPLEAVIHNTVHRVE